jgi:hypothetical protein
MTDEQVESAAQAIRQVFANRSGRGAPWCNLSEHIKNQYRDEARAAFAAAAAVGWLPPGGDEGVPTRRQEAGNDISAGRAMLKWNGKNRRRRFDEERRAGRKPARKKDDVDATSLLSG